MMEAARTSEMLVNFYQTAWCYNPEDSHVRTHCRENLKSYLKKSVLACFGKENVLFKSLPHNLNPVYPDAIKLINLNAFSTAEKSYTTETCDVICQGNDRTGQNGRILNYFY
jgi:hypothetical protein